MKNKILIAKERNHARAVKLTAAPGSRDRYTGQTDNIPAGAMVLCVADPTKGQLLVLHGEMTWEVNVSDYEIVNPSQKLAGKSFCFTGALTHTREYYKALVELHDGSFASGVTKNLNYLVMGDPRSRSTKAEKARSYGTQCIGEKDLLGLIR
jgi:NAD-dependent DNA ligase